MSRHGQAPSQRQLRVAEQVRHILAEGLMRGELHDPQLDGRSITVSEVKISRDLKAATVFVSELGQPLSEATRLALNRSAGVLAGLLGRRMNLRYAPRLHFVPDEQFDSAARFEQILSEARARIAPEGEDDARG